MKISYEGIGYLAVTMPAGNCGPGTVCTVGTDSALNCPAGTKFCGMVVAVENGMAAVQVDGFVKLGYSGPAPKVGYVDLAADGSGKVAVDPAGNNYLVVDVDTANKQLVMKL